MMGPIRVLRLLALFALLAGQANAVLAARLEKPFVVDVPVATQSAEERARASLDGLYQLLQRLSGQSLRDDPTVQSRLADGAERYVLQFSYEKGVPAGGVLLPATFRLRLVYSQNAVTQLLHEANVPTWPLDRPRVLCLMLDPAGQPWPAAPDEATRAALVQLGQHHGLPVAVPLLDTADLQVIEPGLVRAPRAPALAGLTTRYAADAVLALTLQGDDTSGWRGDGAVLFRDDTIPLQANAASLAQLLDRLVQDTAAHLSGQYRGKTAADSGAVTLQLAVTGVDSYGHYIRLQQMLEKLEAVRRLSLVRVEGADLLFDLEVTGEDAFRELLVLSRMVEEVPVPAAAMPQPDTTPPASAAAPQTAPLTAGAAVPVAPPAPPVWHYRWIP